jgi:hypothetical protein
LPHLLLLHLLLLLLGLHAGLLLLHAHKATHCRVASHTLLLGWLLLLLHLLLLLPLLLLLLLLLPHHSPSRRHTLHRHVAGTRHLHWDLLCRHVYHLLLWRLLLLHGLNLLLLHWLHTSLLLHVQLLLLLLLQLCQVRLLPNHLLPWNHALRTYECSTVKQYVSAQSLAVTTSKTVFHGK